MFDTILVPTDGSDQAERALETAAELARRHDGTVHALSVVDVRYLDKATEIDDAETDASVDLAEFVDRVDTDDFSVTTAVRHGVPDEEIRTYAADNDADLIVMGTHGRTGVRRYLLGSVTEKVVRLSDTPVLTVQETEDGTDVSFENILVPTDGSDGARAAARPAAAVATATDATVHALSVVDVRSMGVDVRSDLILDELEKVARSAVGTLEDDLATDGVQSIQTDIVHGVPYQAISSYIDDNDVDLVVMGTHGRTGLERYLLGSVTEKIVRTSPVPVMTVRAPEEAEE
ncbi:universal stress protein [Halomicroarcula sp. GCM10025324]|uniref:universal stress protein n=1 Tax=Haloarcula TaxID=2237 RepID=UPI0023E771F1|nr:universal stress protein [Halomicroarcula sp. ZS-22-S1]